MSKPIKSSARELLFNMMNKYKEKQKEKESLFKQKTECLDIVVKCIEDLDLDSEAKQEVLENLSNLKELEQKELLSQYKYFQDISSMTGVSCSTLKRINNEGKINDGVFRTPGKKRPHPSTVSNLDSFDIKAIRNKINEFYLVKKQVPTLRSLMADLRESINFTGKNGFEFKKNKNQRSVLIERYDQYRTRDGIAEDMEQLFIISVRDEESSSSDESDMGVEYLESEFDYSE